MRSENADKFNHDADAPEYDRDVLNESHPIRAGYEDLLKWVAQQVPSNSKVVDLGSGTGNLAMRIESPTKLICVDVSEQMTRIARSKLAGLPCAFVLADLLECFTELPVVDSIVSTYAIHHLAPTEKPILFRNVCDHLRPGGKAVFGDLMFESARAEAAICSEYSSTGRQNLVDDINDEFFWHLDVATDELKRLGFKVRSKRFSELSWGLLAEKPDS
ncbi:MAG: class I SAM-dependent methyltransferase [Myxococcales bacterium]|nr:class I SAM-dependent methyltransferase [Myxococcales bacterium]